MKMFDADENIMIGLRYGEKKTMTMCHLIPERYGQTDERTDRQIDRFTISISRVSMLTRDKTINFGGQEIKVQRHTTPELDLETWRRHHSRAFLWSSFSVHGLSTT